MSIDALMSGGVITPAAEVTSWLGGTALGAIPIAQGHVKETVSGSSLGSCEITVPATEEWVPSRPDHPLAAMGQELLVRRGFQSLTGDTVGWEILGRFRIWSAEPDGGWLKVDAEAVDARLTPARWVVTTRTSGSLWAQIRQICQGVVPVRFDVPDRPIAARTWEMLDPRRDSLLEVCDAVGAVPRMIDGQLVIVPAPSSTTPQHTLRSGPGGTLISADPISDSDQTPNVVVASSAPEDSSAPVSAMAAIESGPMRWTGPYGQVVLGYASPLLRTRADCLAAARTRLARVSATRADLAVRMITDPRIRLDSVVRVIDDEQGTDAVVRVTEVTHALTAGREPGSLLGQVLSGRVRGQ